MIEGKIVQIVAELYFHIESIDSADIRQMVQELHTAVMREKVQSQKVPPAAEACTDVETTL